MNDEEDKTIYELLLDMEHTAKLWRDRFYLLADELRYADLHQLGEPFVSWKYEAYDSMVSQEGEQYLTDLYQRLTQTVA